MVSIPGPTNSFSGNCRVKSPLSELKFSIVYGVATLDQTQREASSAALERGMVAGLGPFEMEFVTALNYRRKTAELTAT